jgi:hypothetical protein
VTVATVDPGVVDTVRRMCQTQSHDTTAAAAPRPIEGEAVDPIVLEPVDELVVTTLVDNSYDGLMADMGPATRAAMARTPSVPAPQFEAGHTAPGRLAGHAPDLIVPAHCTGWRAQHRLAASLPEAFIPNAVGTTFALTAP